MFLAELGWLTIQWAKLETTLELPCAYLVKANFSNKEDLQPPRAFRQRVKFIKVQLYNPLFVHLRFEFITVLDSLFALSDQRNALIHSTFSEWTKPQSATSTTIKTDTGSYVAHLDQVVTLTDICRLTEQVDRAVRSLINLGDRLRCLIRGFDLNPNFQRRIILRD